MNRFPFRIIDSKLGLIKVFNQDNINEISEESIILNDMTLIPGCKTTLNDFFNAEVTYLGIHEYYMQFKVGEQDDLFGKQIWCNEFKKIDNKRIVTVYQSGTAKDYIFKNGVWK